MYGDGMAKKFFLGLALIVMVFTTGCAQWFETHTKRSAVEEQLLSTSADRAVLQMKLEPLDGRTVYLDTSRFESIDKGYAIAEITSGILDAGAKIVEKKKAQFIIELRSAVLANDHARSIVGLPSIPLALPGLGGFMTPEIALWRRMRQRGWAKFGLTAREAVSGKMLLRTSGYGRSYFKRFGLLFIFTWKTSDIPERRRGAFWGLLPMISD
jgi:Family of unknown function (DUF6655)